MSEIKIQKNLTKRETVLSRRELSIKNRQTQIVTEGIEVNGVNSIKIVPVQMAVVGGFLFSNINSTMKSTLYHEKQALL